MCDYSATGAWQHDGTPMEPEEMPISDTLRRRLDAWQSRFEVEANTQDNNWQGDLPSFVLEGLEIAKALKAELPDWTVVYFDESAARLASGLAGRQSYEFEVTI